MSLTEGPIITLRASLCGRTSLLRRLVSPSAGDWYFQLFEIKGTEDGNVEEEAVVDFREHMDGLAAEELVKVSLSRVSLRLSISLCICSHRAHRLLVYVHGVWLCKWSSTSTIVECSGKGFRRSMNLLGASLSPLENDFFCKKLWIATALQPCSAA